MESDRDRSLLAEMSDSFTRLELMVADLHPTDESDLAKAELVANLKRELASLRSGIEELQTGAWRVSIRLGRCRTVAAPERGFS